MTRGYLARHGKVPALGATARALGLEDGYGLLVLLVQGSATPGLIFGLVDLQDVMRAGKPARTTSPQDLLEP